MLSVCEVWSLRPFECEDLAGRATKAQQELTGDLPLPRKYGTDFPSHGLLFPLHFPNIGCSCGVVVFVRVCEYSSFRHAKKYVTHVKLANATVKSKSSGAGGRPTRLMRTHPIPSYDSAGKHAFRYSVARWLVFTDRIIYQRQHVQIEDEIRNNTNPLLEAIKKSLSIPRINQVF